jgi:hypothetical protein
VNQPHGHDVAVQFFVVCASSDIDFAEAVQTAHTLNAVAASFGPNADAFWSAITAALLGEYDAARQFGVELSGISEALVTMPYSRRVGYRLLAIRKRLQPLVDDHTRAVESTRPGLLGGLDGS